MVSDRYRIMNDCLFFTTSKDEGEIAPGEKATVMVQPNMVSIHQNRRLFLKERYIEEHITVYSVHPQRFTERSFVAVRLVLGHLPSDVFYTSPGTKLCHLAARDDNYHSLRLLFQHIGAKNAYPFLTLEERIVCFMRDLNLFLADSQQEHFEARDEPSVRCPNDVELPV